MVKRALLVGLLIAACSDARGTVLRLRDGDASTGGDDAAVDARDAGRDAGDSGEPPSDAGDNPLGECRIEHDVGFLDPFDLPLDRRRWLIAHGNVPILGERSTGGFVRDNVRLEDGKLVLTVRGDAYTGPVRGFDAGGNPLPDGKRSGAAIATRNLFQSGTYQWESLFDAPPGVKLALLVQRDDPAQGAIGITVPGLAGMMRSYQVAEAYVDGPFGMPMRQQITLPVPLDDGMLHQLRFDWYASGGTGGVPSVDFWQGGENLRSIDGHAPPRAGRAWLVAFVPEGTPAAFESADIHVETTFITTFGSDADRCVDGELGQGVLVEP
jgi:hypothetical protein